MYDCRDVHPDVGRLESAYVPVHFAEWDFRQYLVVEGDFSLDHHFGVSGNAMIVGFRANHPERFAANRRAHRELIGFITIQCRSGYHPCDEILPECDRDSDRFFATCFCVHERLPGILTLFGVDTEHSRSLDFASIGPEFF